MKARVGPGTRADAVIEQLAQRFQPQVLLLHLLHLTQKLVGEDGNIRALDTGGLEDIDNLGGHHGAADDLLDGEFAILACRTRTAGRLDQGSTNRLEEADFLADATRLIRARRQRKGFG